jgi:hypothetical protein
MSNLTQLGPQTPKRYEMEIDGRRLHRLVSRSG